MIGRRVALLAALACCQAPTGAGYAPAAAPPAPATDGAGSGAGGGDRTGDVAATEHSPRRFTGTRLTGWEAACAAALDQARTAPPFERFAMIARACPACGVDWTPVLRAVEIGPDATTRADWLAVEQVLLACETACPRTEREAIRGGFEQIKDTRTVDRPWRTIARACTGAFAPSDSNRLASPAWYVLSAIGRALAGGPSARVTLAQPVDVPVPAAMVTGGSGLELAHGSHVLPTAAAMYLTVMGDDLRLAPAGHAELGPGGITARAVELYPGEPIPAAQLGKVLTAEALLADAPLGLLSAYAAPAVKLVPALAAVGARPVVHLAVFADTPNAGWHDLPRLLAPRIVTAMPDQDAVVIGLVGSGMVGHLRAGMIGAACVRPGGDLDAAGIRALVDGRFPAADHRGAVVELDASSRVEQLAAAVDALAAQGVATVTIRAHAPAAWPAPADPCP